jgi:hypothetical protein
VYRLFLRMQGWQCKKYCGNDQEQLLHLY